MAGTVAEVIVEAMTTTEEAWEAAIIEETSTTGILLKTNSSMVATTNMVEVQVEISVVKAATAVVSSMTNVKEAAIAMAAAVEAMTETVEVTTEVALMTDAEVAATSVAITTITEATRTTTMVMAMDVLAPAHLTRVVRIQATYKPIKMLRTKSANATSKQAATTAIAATTLAATATAAAAAAIADKTTTMAASAASAALAMALIKEETAVDQAVINLKEVTTSSSPLDQLADPRFQEAMMVQTGSTSSSQEEIHPSKGADSAAAAESEHLDQVTMLIECS